MLLQGRPANFPVFFFFFNVAPTPTVWRRVVVVVASERFIVWQHAAEARGDSPRLSGHVTVSNKGPVTTCAAHRNSLYWLFGCAKKHHRSGGGGAGPNVISPTCGSFLNTDVAVNKQTDL